MSDDGWTINVAEWRMRNIRDWNDYVARGDFPAQYQVLVTHIQAWPLDAPISEASLDAMRPQEYMEVVKRFSADVNHHFRT